MLSLAKVSIVSSVVEKAEALSGAGIGPGKALLYKQLLENYSGEGAVDKKRKFLYDSKYLTAHQKKAIAKNFIGDTADKYDWNASNYDEFVFSAESENKKYRWRHAEAWGLELTTYSEMYDIVHSSRKGYDKEAKIADIMQKGWSRAQAEYFWKICTAKAYGA